MKKFFLVCLLFFATSTTVRADFTIEVNYGGPAQFQSAFDNAAATWESLLSGYQDGLVVNRSSGSSYNIGDTVDTLFIDANIGAIDGPNNILGFAGPSEIVLDASGFTLATNGFMTFDSADVPNLDAAGELEAVVLHEMAHVMGFGTLWEPNGVYVPGSGEFTGAEATAFWQSEFGQSGTPDVELGGGGGTAGGHWNEVDFGLGLTGITDQQGRDMRFELMTGWLNAPTFISQMTVGSFVDIGFEAAPPIPEPSSLLLLGLGSLGLCLRRKR